MAKRGVQMGSVIECTVPQVVDPDGLLRGPIVEIESAMIVRHFLKELTKHVLFRV